MTVVTGTLRDPVGTVVTGKVRFHLGGTNGERVTGYMSDGTRVRSKSVDLVNGAYSVDLPSNDVITPAGTRWVRTFEQGAQALYVPTAGPVDERTILADLPASIASAALSAHAATTTLHGGGQELWVAVKSDAAVNTTSTTDVSITGWSAAATVPARPWEIEATVEALGSAATEGGSLTIYIDLPITAISRTSNVVTATLGTGHGVQTGAPVIADLSDNTFDGPFVVTGSAATTVTWAQTAADDADGGTGTLSVRVGVTSSWRAAVATLRPYARFPDIWWQPATGFAYTARPRWRSSAGSATLLSGTFFGSPAQAIMTAATR